MARSERIYSCLFHSELSAHEAGDAFFSFTVSTYKQQNPQDATGTKLVHGFIDQKVKINLYFKTQELVIFLTFFLGSSKFDRCIKNLSIQIYSTLQNNKI